MPPFVIFSQLVARIFRLHRFAFGRLTRRRRHRHVRLRDGRGRSQGAWWSGDSRWFAGGFPPRERNAITPLIDGKDAFEAMLDAIKDAKEYVYIVGWALTPSFAIVRPGALLSEEGLLTAVLAEVSERLPVKILVWSGSPLLFQPSRSLTKLACDEIKREAPRIDIRLDGRARPTHCHHQKALVIDGQVAFVGGLDLTTLEGDRWDQPGHPLRFGRGWHDVALRVEGEAVADLEANFIQRWAAVTKERDLPRQPPRVAPEWHTPCQVVRTIPTRTYPFARRGEFGIAHAYLAAFAGAKRFVYLENQYLWSADVVDVLAEAMDRAEARGERFRIVLVLPARADMGKYDNDKHVDQLREADGGRGMFAAYSLYSTGPAAGPYGFGSRPIYVHAKVGIVDDEWYTAGSANLNRRGLATDTEMNVQVLDPAGARDLRLRLWAEHLGVTTEDLASLDPLDIIDGLWVERSTAVKEAVSRKRGVIKALAHPYQTERLPGAVLLQELQGLLEGT